METFKDFYNIFEVSIFADLEDQTRLGPWKEILP